MVPMGVSYVFVPVTRNAVASIMCGFALTLAFILAFKVVPAYSRTHRHLRGTSYRESEFA